MGELAKIESFRRELAIAESIEELQILNIKGELLAEMAKKLDIPLKGQNELGRTRIDLTKKLRIIIEDKFPVGGDRKSNSKILSLKTEGITFNDSSDAKIIKEEEELVEITMNEIEKAKDIITPKKVASEVRKKKKIKEREQQAEKGKDIILDIDFRLGDFIDVLDDIPNGSVDCIITDPPYPLEFINCWSQLSLFASQKLKPNGFCIAYSGQYNLPEVIKRMGENLDYYWTFALYHTGATQIVNAVNIICRWKPVLIYQNGRRKINNTMQDYIESDKREKDGHNWQQGESGVMRFIELFTNPGDLIVEPFAGSGTTIIAANKMNRNIIAAENNGDTYNLAKSYINNQTKK